MVSCSNLKLEMDNSRLSNSFFCAEKILTDLVIKMLSIHRPTHIRFLNVSLQDNGFLPLIILFLALFQIIF